ncbi:hypothetical protein [Roseovarius sp.]|uniref:hypothetical protein n=1 Tax=Roseovarius sp. TaxID=1486281 RepID=UPI0035671126
MNAPYPPPRKTARRLSEADLERLVARFLANERRQDATFKGHRDTDLEVFLKRLSRKRRQAVMWRCLPQVSFRAFPALRPNMKVAPVRDAETRQSKAARRRRFPLLLLGLLVAGKLGLGLLAEPLLTPVLARVPSNMADQAVAAMRCGDATLLRDTSGESVGVLALHPAASCDGTHLTASFDDETALRIAEAIGVLEGRWTRSPLTLLGQDIVGLVRGGAFEVERWMRGLSRRDAVALWLKGESPTWLPPRGSGPILSTFEALAGQADRVDGPVAKLANIGAAMTFVAASLQDDKLARAHFLSGRMTVLHGTGRPLAGAVAAEVLFDGPPQDLGEICLFAAASTFHLYQDLSVYGKAVEWRHARTLKRAEACATNLADDTSELAEAREVIAAFENPTSMLPVIRGSRRIALRDAMIASGADSLQGSTRLTLDLEAQRDAEVAFDGLLPALSARLGPGLCLSGACEVPADYLFAVAEVVEDGLPLRSVLTNRHRVLFGPFERTANGTVKPRPPSFGLGSQHKALLGLIAMRNEEERLCNRLYGPITNTSGPPPVAECGKEGSEGWIDTATALGISMNLPWVDVARRHAAEMGRLETRLGFLGDAAGPGGAALGVGRRAPPERFMALFAALTRAKLGQPPQTDGLMLLDGHPARLVDLDELGYGGDTARSAAELFSAPLAPNGTLRRLSQRLRPLGCEALMGKTGTTEITSDSRARSRSATVAVSCGSRHFVVFAGIESSRSDKPLGAITARDLEKGIAAVLSGFSLRN